VERTGRAGVPLALLRAAAWGGIAALLVDPGCARGAAPGMTVLLDGSRSMTDATDSARWRAAEDTAHALAGGRGRIVVFGGDLPRAFSAGIMPAEPTSRLLPALRLAAAEGGPVAVVTDGAVDDAAGIPADLLRPARIVLLPRPDRPDAGVGAIAVPAALRAGDSALATVDLAVAGAGPPDSVTLELLEDTRVVARTRVPLGGGGSLRRDLRFVPAPAETRRVRRYEARLTGWSRDSDPRNDRLATLAAVAPTSAIVIVSDQPDWDVRALGVALGEVSGAPVRTFVRVSAGGWRETRTLRTVSDGEVAAELHRASLVVAHGTPAWVRAAAVHATGALVRWPVAEAREGDWYAGAADAASPVGAALAGVAPESLPALELQRDVRADSAGWTALLLRRDRRGVAVPALAGHEAGGRRILDVGATGLWRWASRGGVAGEAHRALVASAADWLLAGVSTGSRSLVVARDSMARGAAELLPRRPVLRAQPGEEGRFPPARLPLRHASWLYFGVIAALVLEWVARRRAGLR